MADIIEIDRLYSIGVVVTSLEEATLKYAEIFGIDAWDVREFGADRLTESRSYGRPTTPFFRTATGTTTPPAGGKGVEPLGNPTVPVTFELIQPLRGESPFQEFRFVRRQGVSHLTVAVRSADAFETLRTAMAGKGILLAASMTVDGALERHFFDTRRALGGYLVEVQVPLQPSAQTTVEVTERWHHGDRYRRPGGVGPIVVGGVNHVGVVVDDLMTSLKQYHEILGVPAWNIRNWRTEPGLLEEPYYRGEQVNHEYFTGRSPVVSDFGFEIIQPTLGPSHYNREFRDRWGPGLHHMLLTVGADVEDWDRTRHWLASINVPLAMGADLNEGAGHFCYYDTADALGGFILEAALIRRMPDPSSPPTPPEYVVDFSTEKLLS
ncbi:hypothetical protein ACIPSE_46155 [Streptomyces sp. NPDC090106]|uniref:hypothetical protein n=1 Tax=Streptomyces sp. NPDC090106 TaxID=3365946 RepID=UPI0037FA13D1